MPLAENKSQIIVSVYKLTVDGNTFPHFLNMRIMLGYQEVPGQSAAHGTTPLGYWVTGHAAEVTIEAQQLSAQLSEFLGLNSGVPLAVGATLPEHSVQIHPVSMGADTSQDIYIPVAVFGPTVDSAKDGSNTDRGTVMLRGVLNPDGPVWRMGPEPDPEP
jgi:hypothetical protein